MSDKFLLNYHDAVIYASDLSILDSPTAWLNDACINFQMTRLQHRKREDQGNDHCGKKDFEQLSDLFLDPSVISYLMHQCDENEEDFPEEMMSLNQAWGLTKFQALSESSQSKKLSKRIFVPINDQFNHSRAAFTRPGGGSHWSLLLWKITLDPPNVATSENKSLISNFYHFDSSSGYNASAATSVSQKLLKVLNSIPHQNNDPIVTVESVKECKTPQQNNGYDCGLHLLGFAEALSLMDDDLSTSQERYEAALREYANAGKDKTCASVLRMQISTAVRELIP